MNKKYFAVKEENIPQFMTNVPWYVTDKNNEEPKKEIKNLYKNDENPVFKTSYKIEINTISNKFRPGSCENCGAITHKKKDCFERPRLKNAKFSNVTFGNDEYLKEEKLNYDAAHDRWNNYDPSNDELNIMLNQKRVLLESEEKEEQKIDKDKKERKDNERELNNKDDRKEYYKIEEFIDLVNKNNVAAKLNLFSNPTEGEMLKKNYDKEILEKITEKKEIVKEKYKPIECKLPDEIKYKLEKGISSLVDNKECDNDYMNNGDLSRINNYIELKEIIKGHKYCFGSIYDKENDAWGYKCCNSYDYNSKCKNITMI